MQFLDSRGLDTGAASQAAHEALCEGVERLLGAQAGVQCALERALAQDPECALAWAALARHHQTCGRASLARQAMAHAMRLCGLESRVPSSVAVGERVSGLTPPVPARVVGVVQILERLLAGASNQAFTMVQEHLAVWPRDALVMAPCAGVFGIFGFSGRLDREFALLEFLERYRAACAQDWWFQSAIAFAYCETGQIAPALEQIERSLEQRPQSANGAHIRTHVAYEAGEHAQSLAWLERWMADYSREGLMHCHLGWHLALAAMKVGDLDQAWSHYRTKVAPGAAWGPPLNLLTDSASFLLRMQWAGAVVSPKDWADVSEVASQAFSSPGVSFADLHALISHERAGHPQRIQRIAQAPEPCAGTAGDLIQTFARGLLNLIEERPEQAMRNWQIVLENNVRLGGSRAQRELVLGLFNDLGQRHGHTPKNDEVIRPNSARSLEMKRGS